MLNTSSGLIAHIDFGFAFDIAPGGKFSFERAPFKLSEESLSVIGGWKSAGYHYFKQLFRQGMLLSKLIGQDVCSIIRLMTNILPGIKSLESADRFMARLQI